MSAWLYLVSVVAALSGGGAYFLSDHPILYTRLFVPHCNRLYVRREIMEDDTFEHRMRRMSFALLGISGVLVVGTFVRGFFV